MNMYLNHPKDRKDPSKPFAAQQLAGTLHKRSKTGFEKADVPIAPTRPSRPQVLLFAPETTDPGPTPSLAGRPHNRSLLEAAPTWPDASRDPSKSVVRETKLHKNRPQAILSRGSQADTQTVAQSITHAALQPVRYPTLPSHSFMAGSRQSLVPRRLDEKRTNTVANIQNRSDASTPVHRECERPHTTECDCLGYSRCVLLLESMSVKDALTKYEAVIRKLSEKLKMLREENASLRTDNGRVKMLESLLVDQRVGTAHKNKNHELSRLCSALCSRIGFLKSAVMPSIRGILAEVRELEVCSAEQSQDRLPSLEALPPTPY